MPKPRKTIEQGELFSDVKKMAEVYERNWNFHDDEIVLLCEEALRKTSTANGMHARMTSLTTRHFCLLFSKWFEYQRDLQHGEQTHDSF